MKFFYFIARNISYTFAVTFFICLFGLPEIILSYIISASYITVSYEKIYKIFVYWMPYGFLTAIVVFFIMSGFLTPVKIPALTKRYRRINKAFRQNMDVDIKNLKETYGDFSDLVMNNTALSFFFIFLTALFMIGVCLYRFHFKGEISLDEIKIVFKMILIASVISMILFGMTTLLLSEFLTNRERSDLYNEIVKNGEIMKPYSFFSIRINFTFFVFLTVIILFTFAAQFEKLKAFNKSNTVIFTYVLISIFIVFFFSWVNAKSIQRILNDISRVTREIASGKREGFRFLSLSRELTLVEFSLMETFREIDEYRKNLELTILERTDELEKALDNIRNRDDLIKKQLDMAGQVQQSVYLAKIDDWNEIRFSVRHNKGSKPGGDYYDIFQLADNKIGILMANFQGNDITAALVKAMAKIFFTNAAERFDSPGRILQEVNFNIITHIKKQDGLTCFMGVFDDNYNLTYSNAGDLKSVIYRKESGETEILETDNKSIGSDEKTIVFFEEKITKLNYGDRLILYTDGVPEVLDVNSGENPIINNKDSELEEFADALLHDVHHTGDEFSLIILELISDEAVEIIKSSRELINNFKYTDAIELMENGLEKYPDNLKILYNLGKEYFRVNKYNEAVQVLERYIGQDNRNKSAFYVNGACHYQMMDFKKAIEYFSDAIQIDPYMINALFALGMSHKNLGDYDIALEIFRRVSNIDPDHKMSLFEIKQTEKLKNETLS